MVLDSGFNCSWEVGFAKIGHRMQDSDKKESGMQDFHKGAGMWDQDPLSPFQTLVEITIIL